MEKPRVKFCWECGRKLYGNHHVLLKVHGEVRTLHKQCAKIIINDKEDYEAVRLENLI